MTAAFDGQPLVPVQPKAEPDLASKDGRSALGPANNAQFLSELIDNLDDSTTLVSTTVDRLAYIMKFNHGSVPTAQVGELKT